MDAKQLQVDLSDVPIIDETITGNRRPEPQPYDRNDGPINIDIWCLISTCLSLYNTVNQCLQADGGKAHVVSVPEIFTCFLGFFRLFCFKFFF